MLLALPSFGQAPSRVVSTLSDLDSLTPGLSQLQVEVQGYDTPGDWGSAKTFRWDSASTAETNAIVRATRIGQGRWVHDWDGDVTAFGAVPYRAKHTLAPWGYKANASAIGYGDFSVWLQVDFPSDYTQPVGLFEISPAQATNSTTATLSSLGHRASPQNWGFVFRSTTGGSGAGSDTNGAAVLDSTPAALAAYAGRTVDVVLTRSGTNAVVYFDGTNVTSLFTFSNPLGWGKSLALGSDLLMQVGNNVVPWYWPKPIRRFAVWGSALNLSQSANPGAVGSKLVDFTPSDVAEPPDLTDKINAAGDYAVSVGGMRVFFPPGVYRVDGDIRVGQRVWWQGSGSSPYPSVFNQAHRPSSTTLNAWFGATNHVFYGSSSQGSEICLSLRSVSGLGSGLVSSTWLRSRISDLTISGPMSYASEGIFLDRVAAVEIENVSFYGIPGHEVRCYVGNNIKLTGCDAGSMGRGVDFRGGADIMMQNNFFDSPKGPAIRWALNLSKAINNTFEVSQNPRVTVPVYESLTSVNYTNDEFTVTNYYGHRLLTGQPIRFDVDDGSTNSLPPPLSKNTDYFVIKTGRDTFKVSTTYADQVALTGAAYGNDVLDITTNGVGSWYSGTAQSFNFLISGDHNLFIGNHGQQGYDGGMRLEGGLGIGGNNSIIGNSFVLSGYGNPNSNNVAGLVLVDSDYNVVTANQLDDRDNSSYSQNAVIADANSLYNTFVANSWNVSNPYTLGTPYRNTVLDAQYVHFSSGNVLMSDGVSGASTNTYRALRVNNSSLSAQWSADSGTLTGTNSGAAQRMLYIESPYYGGVVRIQINAASSSQRPELYLMKNYSTNSGTFAPPPVYSDLGGLFFGGYRGTDSSNEVISSGILSYTDGIAWNLTNVNSQINIMATPQNRTTMLSGLLLQFQTETNKDFAPIAVASTDGTNWSSAGSASGFRFKYHTNDSGGTGFRAVIVPNK